MSLYNFTSVIALQLVAFFSTSEVMFPWLSHNGAVVSKVEQLSAEVPVQ
jgi:hypothetical protein